MFKPVESKVDIQKVEQEQLEFWRLNRIFQRTLEGRDDAPRYVFYEGPPTANGLPGSHHVLARAFKDMFPRYKVMNGYYVERRGGWDTHGLPVEIAVEQELGFKNKQQIEEFGIAPFNEKSRASVFRHISEWEKLTERIAFWVDLDKAYVTFTNDYIESSWWILKQFWEKNLLYQGYKVVPYCTRCGTPLSSHEVSQGYDTIKDPSVFVRFPVKDQVGVYFLAWTTTPWTLPGNAALAVGENVDYVQVEGDLKNGEGKEQLILAESLLNKVLFDPETYKVVKRFKGKDLVGMEYNPLYTFLPSEKKHAYVIAGDFVSTEDGTGIVHIAPAFGQDDSEMGRKYDLPTFITVDATGRFIDAVTKFKGLWFKDADPEISQDLKERGLLYRSQKYEHNYPFCWRCQTPLMYFARETWYIRTTAFREKMIALNQTINWVPDHIKDGRFGNWLDDLKDWALGRERYWGTPLPVWLDEKTGESYCVGSVKELEELTGRSLSDLDLHRPHVDNITFLNPNGNGNTMRRVPEVIDVWFDSGAMPLAQWGYPHKNQEKFKEQYPADYICEAVDQTRGWFYSLHAISTMLFEQVAYKNVICLGHILDENGQKMSKSRGNIVNPWDVLNEHGADAFRWYMYTSGPPGEPRRFSLNLVGEVVKKFWLTLWNTYSFFVTYANLDGWTPDKVAPSIAERDLLDRWVLSELNSLVANVTEAYDSYDVTKATRPIEEFVDGLSNWYVRLSRRRFWKSESDADKMGAYATLYECLVTVSQLLAPAMPFLSDAIYRNLAQGTGDSVHLASWPQVNRSAIDTTLEHEMALVRQLVSMGLAARNSADMSVRQPLKSVSFGVGNPEERRAVRKYEQLIKDELNVKLVDLLQDDAGVTSYTLSPSYAKLGKKLRGDVKLVAALFQNASAEQTATWAKALLGDENITVTVEDRSYELTPTEIEVRQEAATEGFVVFEEKGYVAALDTNLTEDLIRERNAREIVRRIQTARKEANFNIEDRIDVAYQASGAFEKAIEQFAEYIKAETLAQSLSAHVADASFYTQDFSSDFRGDLDGEKLIVSIKRV